MSYQIFVPKQPDTPVRLWAVAIVGVNVDELMPFLHGSQIIMVSAKNKAHAKRKLKPEIKRIAKLAFNKLGRRLTVSACLTKDF